MKSQSPVTPATVDREAGGGCVHRRVRRLSFRRIWTRCWLLGIGVGWDETDRTACVLIQLGPCLLTIGPHIAPNREIERKEVR